MRNFSSYQRVMTNSRPWGFWWHDHGTPSWTWIPKFAPPGSSRSRNPQKNSRYQVGNDTQWYTIVQMCRLDLWISTFVTHGLTHTDIHFPSPPEATFVTVFFQCRSPLVAQGVAEMLAVRWAMKGISWELGTSVFISPGQEIHRNSLAPCHAWSRGCVRLHKPLIRNIYYLYPVLLELHLDSGPISERTKWNIITHCDVCPHDFMQWFCFKRECLMDCSWQCFKESFVWILAQGALLLRVEAPLGLEPKLPPVMHREMHGRILRVIDTGRLVICFAWVFQHLHGSKFHSTQHGRMRCLRFLVPFEEGHVRAYYYMLVFPCISLYTRRVLQNVCNGSNIVRTLKTPGRGNRSGIPSSFSHLHAGLRVSVAFAWHEGVWRNLKFAANHMQRLGPFLVT